MNPYLPLILAFLAGSWLLDAVADLLNLRHAAPELPDEFRDVFDSEKYRRAQTYLGDHTRFDLGTNAFMLLVTLAFILGGGFGALDAWARSWGWGPIPTGLLFAGTLALLSALIHIPFNAYATFAIEARYGFNRTTARTFILDLLKAFLLAAVIGGIALAGVLWFFQTAGPLAWLYAWLAVTAFELLLLVVAPVLIMPLFNRFAPLPDGAVKTALTDYIRAQNFRHRGIFTMDGSRRSAKANAFFTGFGRLRRVVLFDTLIAKHPPDELVAVVAHEIGHYKKKHLWLHLAMSIAIGGLMFAGLNLFIANPAPTAALGIRRHSLYAGLIAFGFLAAPMLAALSVGAHALARRNEYAADRYAAATCGHPAALIAALKRLSADNLANLTPHPLKVLLDYSHPPVLARIRALRGK
jgi:STE24 endopeptidase